MNGYWPWWVGALALGSITVGYALWTGRGLGVSGAWARVASWRQCRDLERLDSTFGDEAQLQAAIAAATLDEFGPPPGPGDYPPPATAGASGVQTLRPRSPQTEAPAPATGPTPRPTPAAQPRPMPLICYAALLVAMFVGGLIGSVRSGRFSVRADMGEGFARIVTDNSVVMVVVLMVGGILVGFGTRMAGGCSSGHGLTGCSRLQPVSILATAVFFGTAVVVSWLLWKVV